MAVPNTLGKLCTNLKDMEVGDYIKCEYIAPTAGKAGSFGNIGESTLSELPTAPETTANGYFYLIKVDKGLCIADRMIQTNISWDALNKANFIMGNNIENLLFRILSRAEFLKYITNGSCEGKIKIGDNFVWHDSRVVGAEYISENIIKSLYAEILGDITNNTIGFIVNLDMKNVIFNFRDNSGRIHPYTVPSTATTECSNKRDTWIYNGYRGYKADITTYLSFRPVLEFIDNPKSIDIWK